MCPNAWEKRNQERIYTVLPTCNIFKSNAGRVLDNVDSYNSYQGIKIFNDLLKLVPQKQRAENFLTNTNTNDAIEQTKRNGLWANTAIMRNNEIQPVSPEYSQVFLKDGRVGYIISKSIKNNWYKALIIDNDYVLREYQFTREPENNPAVGYCLLKYPTF